jgi:DNA-3-methyladenine glycosylase
MKYQAIPQSFFDRSPLAVGPELLGKLIVRTIDGKTIVGRIVEVEAYLAYVDEAAHGFKGPTKRNASLFLSAGHIYVHTIHLQNCLDVVTENAEIPSSVLIRALEPIEGIELMQELRKKESLKDLTSGPGKLCQALAITREIDGVDGTDTSSPLYFADDNFVPAETIATTRVGITKAAEQVWRFYTKGNPHVSKR